MICSRIASVVEDVLARSLDALGTRDFIFGRSTTIPSTIYDTAAETPVPQLPSRDFLRPHVLFESSQIFRLNVDSRYGILQLLF